jgi:hypothetical protein
VGQPHGAEHRRQRRVRRQRGYPAIIEPERHARILDGLRRLEPSAVQRRQGGRRPADTSCFLRASRSVSDAAPRYTREQAAGRVYVCANCRPLSPCGAIDPR